MREPCFHFSSLLLTVPATSPLPQSRSPHEDVNPEILIKRRNVEDTLISE